MLRFFHSPAIYSLTMYRFGWYFLFLAIIFSSCASGRKTANTDNQIDTVIKSARSFTGTPYKWGGMTRSGMDCSGLLCNAFSSIDYSLPRTSAAQSQVGDKVKKNEIRPGDLVFFATGRSRRKVTHVGLVTTVKKGEVWFIHSSSSLGVIESKLSTNYYAKRFLMARRPID
ncbi:MAG: C40 family peptidase [Cyclobacteriaceae bacterium]